MDSFGDSIQKQMPGDSVEMVDIFISYSHKDAQLASIICKKIKDASFSCWIDSDKLRVGDNFTGFRYPGHKKRKNLHFINFN